MLLGFTLRRVTMPNGERLYFWDVKETDAACIEAYTPPFADKVEGGKATDGGNTDNTIRYLDRDDSATAD